MPPAGVAARPPSGALFSAFFAEAEAAAGAGAAKETVTPRSNRAALGALRRSTASTQSRPPCLRRAAAAAASTAASAAAARDTRAARLTNPHGETTSTGKAAAAARQTLAETCGAAGCRSGCINIPAGSGIASRVEGMGSEQNQDAKANGARTGSER